MSVEVTSTIEKYLSEIDVYSKYSYELHLKNFLSNYPERFFIRTFKIYKGDLKNLVKKIDASKHYNKSNVEIFEYFKNQYVPKMRTRIQSGMQVSSFKEELLWYVNRLNLDSEIFCLNKIMELGVVK